MNPRPDPTAPAPAGDVFVGRRAFVVLAVGFVLLDAGVLAATWRQSAARAELEQAVPLAVLEPAPVDPPLSSPPTDPPDPEP